MLAHIGAEEGGVEDENALEVMDEEHFCGGRPEGLQSEPPPLCGKSCLLDYLFSAFMACALVKRPAA